MGYNNNFSDQNWGADSQTWTETTPNSDGTSNFESTYTGSIDQTSFESGALTWDAFLSEANQVTGWLNDVSDDGTTKTGLAYDMPDTMRDEMSAGSERRSMADQSRNINGGENEERDWSIKEMIGDWMKSYSGSSDETKKGVWSLVAGAMAAYGKRGQSDYYKSQSKAAMMNAQTNAATLQNKIAMQGSAGAAWQNVKKPGLINYQPLQINDISKRVV